MTDSNMTELTAQVDEPVAPEATPESSGNRRAVRAWQGLFVLILIGFVGLLAARLIQTNQSEHRASGTAPAFSFTTFDGETISSADLLGKGVVLNFWASWCDPCRDEAELLEATWRREQGGDIVFLGLDYLDQEPAALAYLDEYNVSYPNGPDLQSAAARSYGIKGVPETFFIDAQGNIVDIVIGPIASQAQMDEYLSKIRP
jgi:cytochrome c biogenesis protein CcmG/thiol:disulfide interchange protein DsbE